MTRSAWKPLFVDRRLLKIVLLRKSVFGARSAVAIKSHSRRSMILSLFLGLRFSIYNGKRFFSLTILEYNFGTRLGEYSFSKRRTQAIHFLNKAYRKKLKLKKLKDKALKADK